MEWGRVAAEAAYRALQPGEAAGRRGALSSYDDALRESFIWNELRMVRNMRPAFGYGFWRGSAIAGAATMSMGRSPRKDLRLERDAEHELLVTERAKSYPAPDGRLTFDKLS